MRGDYAEGTWPQAGSTRNNVDRNWLSGSYGYGTMLAEAAVTTRAHI